MKGITVDITSILIIVSIGLLTAAFIFKPFLTKSAAEKKESAEQTKIDHVRSSLLAEKERVLSALQELDFDHTLHKIPEEEYPVQRAALMTRAAEIMQALDEMGVATAAPVVDPAAKAGSGQDYDEVEALIAKRRGETGKQNKGFCPKCGQPILENDRFCPKCGQALTSAVKGKNTK
jgi:hypothetical protein